MTVNNTIIELFAIDSFVKTGEYNDKTDTEVINPCKGRYTIYQHIQLEDV